MPASESLWVSGAGALIDWEVLVEMEMVDIGYRPFERGFGRFDARSSSWEARL